MDGVSPPALVLLRAEEDYEAMSIGAAARPLTVRADRR